jgi:hypothetical protein
MSSQSWIFPQQDREQISDAGDLVVKAYMQWGNQPAETAEWKQRLSSLSPPTAQE